MSKWGPSCIWVGPAPQRIQLLSLLSGSAEITILLGRVEPMLVLSIKHSQVGSWVPEAFVVLLVPYTMTADPENDDSRVRVESKSA